MNCDIMRRGSIAAGGITSSASSRNSARYRVPSDPRSSTSHDECPFLKSYSHLLIQTCHNRGAHAIGGMATQIPVKNNEDANRIAFEKVRLDKLREVNAGHDGHGSATQALFLSQSRFLTNTCRSPTNFCRKSSLKSSSEQTSSGRSKGKHNSCRLEYQHQRGPPISGGLVGRQGCCSDQQSHGRRGNR